MLNNNAMFLRGIIILSLLTATLTVKTKNPHKYLTYKGVLII